jgi:hypothetical protein
MEDLNEGIVERYAEHLLKRASSLVVSFTFVGVIAGAALGAAPGFLSHSLIPGGTKYFAVLLGLIAGGFLGRTTGERRALGLRLQAQMALRQLQLESRFVTAPAAPAARPAAPAPVSPAVTPPAATAPAASAPVAPAAPVPTAVRAPALTAPAPAQSAPASSAPPAPPTPAETPSEVRPEVPVAVAPAGPRLVEPSAATLPPLSATPF